MEHGISLAMMVEQEPPSPPVGRRSLMTPLGVVSGEVLTHVERHQVVSLSQLIRWIGEEAPMVVMAVGALAREGLVQAVHEGNRIMIRALACELSSELSSELTSGV